MASDPNKKGLISDLLHNDKYRLILSSLGVLLLALTLALIVTYFFVSRAEQATSRMDLIGDFSDEVLFITNGVQNLSVIGDNTQERAFAISKLQARAKSADELISTLSQEKHDDAHNHNDTLHELEALWRDYSDRIQTLRPSSSFATITALGAFGYEQQHAIYDGVTVAYDDYYVDSRQMTDYARYTQIVTFIGLLLFLALFIGYALQRMRTGDALLEDAQQQTSDILKTVNEGLFLVDQELVLSGQYSKSLETILDSHALQGKRLDELLHGAISEKDLSATRLFIDQLYNPWVVEDLIQDLNPLKQVKVTKLDSDGLPYSKYLNFDFLRVSDGDEGDTISKVFVSVTDVTDAVLLQETLTLAKAQHERELEMISAILTVDTKHLLYFIDNTAKRIDEMNDTLKTNTQAGAANLNQKAQALFREMHSLKGDASALKLEAFVGIAEQQESKLKRLLDKPNLSGDDFLGFTVGLDELLELNLYMKDLLTRLHVLGDKVADKNPPKHWQTYFEDYAQDLGARHGKQVALSVVGFDELSDHPDFNIYKDIAVQFLKNAIVHGIETPEKRSINGKPSLGQVALGLIKKADKIELSISDDGQGIDWQAVRTRAVTLGYVSQEQAHTLNQKQLYALLLKAGLSTSSEQNEDAGRGVGMSLVYDLTQKADGRLQIQSEPNQYTQMSVLLSDNRQER